MQRAGDGHLLGAEEVGGRKWSDRDRAGEDEK
jgi:hypothetical protein